MLGLLSAALAGASQVLYIMMVMVMAIICWACLSSAAFAGATQVFNKDGDTSPAMHSIDGNNDDNNDDDDNDDNDHNDQ